MKRAEIIIIGGGASGLMCARELGEADQKVTVLEAKDRLGGRIHSLTDHNFPLPVELGAEFIHGDLPQTQKLLKEAAIKFFETKGDLWRLEQGRIVEQDDFIEDVEEVIKKLKKLPSDISVADFLELHFNSDNHASLRKTLRSYVEGYTAADTKLASSFALLQGLLGEEDRQYRVIGGYKKMIEYLAGECETAGCTIHLETVAKEIRWRKREVEVLDTKGNSFVGEKLVITASLGVLQSSPNNNNHLVFSPGIGHVQKAIDSLGFGTVIKVILNFDQPIWKFATNIEPGKNDPGFLFSDAIIPTWWTQVPEKNGMITGWLSGPNASRLQDENDDTILHMALESLSIIFQIPRKTLEAKLIGSHVYNWFKDEFEKGAYSYETVDSKEARITITSPIEETLYFAGEAYFEGSANGTVEAALVNGQECAKKILKGRF